MTTIRVTAGADEVEDGQLNAEITEQQCTIEIDYGDSITRIDIEPKQLIEWAEAVTELTGSFCKYDR